MSFAQSISGTDTFASFSHNDYGSSRRTLFHVNVKPYSRETFQSTYIAD